MEYADGSADAHTQQCIAGSKRFSRGFSYRTCPHTAVAELKKAEAQFFHGAQSARRRVGGDFRNLREYDPARSAPPLECAAG